MIEVKDLNDVPEKYRADYVEVEKDGVKIFQHKDFLTVIGAMKRKSEERDTLANELKGYKSKEAERVAEAERKALEKLKAEGKIDEILADNEKRHGETIKQYEELEARIKQFSPDILLVGDDYVDKPVVGSQFAKKVVFFPRYGGLSSSNIIGR